MNFKVFVGLDVSKKTFDVSICINNKYTYLGGFPNDNKGVPAFMKEIGFQGFSLNGALICMEHTGIYTHLLLERLYNKNYKDSMRITEYARRFQYKAVLWQPPRKELVRLKNLVSLRNRLIKAKKMLAVPINEMAGMPSTSHRDVKRINAPVLDQIDRQLKETETQIEATVRADGHLKNLHEIVTSVDGVGKVTSWQIILCTNEFKDFADSRKFACYSGVVPFDHSSGSSIDNRPRVSHMANKKMKELLHLSALSATVMKGEYYLRKVKEGKNKMLVLNNIRNKLVHRIFTCVRENRKYEKNYTQLLV